MKQCDAKIVKIGEYPYLCTPKKREQVGPLGIK